MIIYQIKNKINGLRYVGQTVRGLIKRWNLHCKGSRCPFISNAIQKYGKENFTIEIIDRASDINELNCKEEFWIKFLDTISPNGYNLTSGGENKMPSPETKLKMSVTHSGKKHSLKTKQKMSEIKKKYFKENGHPCIGIKQSAEHINKRLESRSASHKAYKCSDITKKKISEALKGRKLSHEVCKKRTGKKHSEETKKKMSEARLKYLSEKKALKEKENAPS